MADKHDAGPMVGAIGANYIRKELSESEDPEEAIARLQSTLCLDNKMAEAAIPLLNFLGVDRSGVYKVLLSTVTARLLVGISALSEETKLDMLGKTFPYIEMETIRSVPVALMKSMHAVPRAFLEEVIKRPGLYQTLPHEVKQQCWHVSDEVFSSELRKIFDEYIDDHDDAAVSWLFVAENGAAPPPHRRREQRPSLQRLVEVVGGSPSLYKVLLTEVKKRFAATGDERYCALRSEIIMTFHDRNDTKLLAADPVHELAWCLDACAKASELDENYVNEMQKQFNSYEEGSAVFGDAAMVLRCPHTMSMLVHSMFTCLGELLEDEDVPRSDDLTVYVATLIETGLHAREAVTKGVFRLHDCAAKRSVTDVLALVMGMMVEDAWVPVHKQLKTMLPRTKTELPPRGGVPAGLIEGGGAMRDGLAILMMAHYVQGCLLLGDLDRAKAVAASIAKDCPPALTGSVGVSFAAMLCSEAVTDAARDAIVYAGLLPLARKSHIAHLHLVRLMGAVVCKSNLGDVKNTLQSALEECAIDDHGIVRAEYDLFFREVTGTAAPHAPAAAVALIQPFGPYKVRHAATAARSAPSTAGTKGTAAAPAGGLYGAQRSFAFVYTFLNEAPRTPAPVDDAMDW